MLDGIRALSVLIVAWYHIWQQSWLSPIVRAPWLRFLGRTQISLDIVPRTGFLFVDMMLLLSGFCLFLPHARSVFFGEPPPAPLTFYKKRAIRILPSYYLCVLALFFFYALPQRLYASNTEMWRDLAAMCTFTQTYFPQVLLGTKLNGVLWTVAVEMRFYLLFPLLAAAFRRQPILTYLGMAAVSSFYIHGVLLPNPDLIRTGVNQFPGFLGVFANGMLGAYAYVAMAKHIPRSRALTVTATLVFALSILLVRRLLYFVASGEVQANQLLYRFVLSLAFLLLVLSAAFSARAVRFLLGNRVMVFFAGISYNLYIWHQWLCVRLKFGRIPYWAGETLPNVAGDRAWQTQYTALSFLLAIAVAILLTYCFERPVAKRLAGIKLRKRKDKDHALPT